MSFQKDIVKGQYGSVFVSEAGGQVVVSAGVSASLGGGQAQGVASVSGSVSISLEAKQVIDLGLDLAAVKYPAAASLIQAAKAAIDAELAKA